MERQISEVWEAGSGRLMKGVLTQSWGLTRVPGSELEDGRKYSRARNRTEL